MIRHKTIIFVILYSFPENRVTNEINDTDYFLQCEWVTICPK